MGRELPLGVELNHKGRPLFRSDAEAPAQVAIPATRRGNLIGILWKIIGWTWLCSFHPVSLVLEILFIPSFTGFSHFPLYYFGGLAAATALTLIISYIGGRHA